MMKAANPRYIPLKTCIAEAFMNPDRYPIQDERQQWALYEGFWRHGYDWVSPTANPNPQARAMQECHRGCVIRRGELYFRYQYGDSYTSYIKLCSSCTAMILFFTKSWELPVYQYTHWDLEEKRPVRLDS